MATNSRHRKNHMIKKIREQFRQQFTTEVQNEVDKLKEGETNA